MTNRDVFGCVECLRHKHECPDCVIARLTRERDEAIGNLKSLEAHYRFVGDELMATRKEVLAARAHFRRACEYLATFCFSRGPAEKSVDEWQAEIVADLEGKP